MVTATAETIAQPRKTRDIMPDRNVLTSRSGREWGVRGALGFVALALGYFSFTSSLAEVIKTQMPERAHALAPYNAQITALLAAKGLLDRPEPGQQAETQALALAALRQDPTVVHAIVTLGLQALMKQDLASAKRLFNYSQQLSRRDLQTQSWAIEDAIGRNDIPAALYHYDVALRTDNKAQELLFPILSKALDEPEIRANLVKVLAKRPSWSSQFIIYLAGNSWDHRATAALYADLPRVGITLPPEVVVGTVDSLLKDRAYDEAWKFYASVRSEANQRYSRDANFAVDLDLPSAFDWVLVNEGGTSSSLQTSGTQRMFEYSVRSSLDAVILKQMQVLPAGKYRISGHAARQDQFSGPSPYWTMTCVDGRELGRVEMLAQGRTAGAFDGEFVVPADCRLQTLALVARASAAGATNSGIIDRVQLSPALG